MKINLLLKERKLQLFFLVYTLLLVPSMSLIAQNIPIGTLVSGIVVCLGLLLVIFILSSFMTTKGIRIFYSVLLGLTLIPGAIFLSYLVIGNVLLSEGTITTLFETNTSESKEFISSYMSPWLVLGIALYILFPVVMIFKMRHMSFHRVGEHKRIFATCILLLLLFFAIEPVAQRIYFVDFYRIFADYKIRTKLEEKAIITRQKQPFKVSVSEKEAPRTFVIVIGESLSRRHMSLYGYERDTNPLLSARKSDLKIYQDVVSPQVHTIPALRSILTFADDAHPEYLTERPSLFELFNRAGYETYHISNQPVNGAGTSYEPLLKLANHTYDLSITKEPDGVLLNALEESLKDEKRKLIVVHLMGSHTVYKFRYPLSFDYFDYQKHPIPYTGSYMNDDVQTTIDQYDSSVRYNDHLIASMIDLLSTYDSSSAMLYFSDHGEEVYDYRDFTGHAFEKISTYMCEVPFVVWMSDDFKKKRKDLNFDVNRPYSTTDILYSLSDMGGLSFEGFDESRSVFSTRFTPRTRFVGNLSYESVKDKMIQEQMDNQVSVNWAFLKDLKKDLKDVIGSKANKQ